MYAVPLCPIPPINVCPESKISIYFAVPATSESVQKIVVLHTIPDMIAVPPLVHVLMIFPVEGSRFPEIACTCIHEIVIVSSLFALLTLEKVTVMVVVVTVIEHDVKSPFGGAYVHDTEPLPALNFQLVGAVSISVALV